MTKSVRIENADANAFFKVRVTAQHRNAAGEWVDQPSPVHLQFPCAQITEGIHETRRLIVEEYHE